MLKHNFLFSKFNSTSCSTYSALFSIKIKPMLILVNGLRKRSPSNIHMKIQQFSHYCRFTIDISVRKLNYHPIKCSLPSHLLSII
ncbi:putative uncharacterized protein [Aliivibrio wodanis]|uniref:Uncharacterized protein n=1 Tax=Aliivibrio wodanis TaxID=80852 RepID=A0A090I643_9GAMM|nr:putative uncharacterized protein [Aliivibrio wodanis]